MRRIALITTLLAACAASLATVAGAEDTREYEIEMYNAFGIVEGSDFRVSGVNYGAVTGLELNAAKRAVVTVEVTGPLSELGRDTECSTDPQSLIAEYVIDCTPKGPPLPEDDDSEPDIPASQVTQTVQNDLVANTLREPYKRRLQLLINEFGTALAGNPENLNEAIRLGAPTLTQLKKVTGILADQNTIIRDLNADSDLIVGKLNERRDDVVGAIQELRDTAAASAERRADLSRDFEILDDFLFELKPVLAELTTTARQSTPLFTDLRAAAPGLNRLALNFPPFNDATRVSLESLGDASVVGRRALRRGADEIKALADAGVGATTTGEILADFLRDLDDPSRAVEIDRRVGFADPARPNDVPDTGRTNPTPGQSDTMGYTGLEGLLNYAYYQATSTNQYDQVGHLLHFSLYDFEQNLCGHWSAGRDPVTGAPGVPDDSSPTSTGTTTNVVNAAPCVAWLGPNQPGFSGGGQGDALLTLPPYDDSVCPQGTEPANAAATLCPGGSSAPARGEKARARRGATAGADTASGSQAAPGGGGPLPQVPGLDDLPLPRNLDDLLDLPNAGGRALDDLPPRLQNELLGGGSRRSAAEDLLDFLFAP